MVTIFQLPDFNWHYLALLLIFVLAGIATIFLLALFSRKGEQDLSNYVRKPYLFDSKAEFELFKILVELYGDTYYIFPQVHYIHLIQPRKDLPYNERFGYRSRIGKKSADFVLCEKNGVTAQLIIELDGPTHDLPDRQKRDEFINEITKVAGMKIVHLKVRDMNRDFVRSEVDNALRPSSPN